MLVLVHLLIAIHIAQWLITGSTVSPVEPSESMETLEVGSVNAGFVFFLLAIVSTLIVGRFFCGWGCHIVALQDLCAAFMKKLRVRPKPFRSRLLVFAPLVLGLYMFVWPTFKRAALLPMLGSFGIDTPVWLGVPNEIAGFRSELIVQDFWATFPPWYVAIPFLGVCGFASVYFLGSKGFCTYGCPYGGIFGVVDRVSPGRIVVSDACESCGHCTAVCTSNVRVHEEVRDFGAVVDPGCMKCMDCVSACPNDALSFSFTKPGVLIRPRDAAAADRRRAVGKNPKRFDLTRAEELVVALLFVAYFLAFRGMLNLVPMLMAVGMAGVGTFVTWKAWSLIRRQSVRLQSLELKSKGRLRLAGYVLVVGATVTVASAIWSGVVGLDRWRAHLLHEKTEIPLAVAFRPEFSLPLAKSERVADAIGLFERSDALSSGGMGWNLRPQDRRELAYLYVLQGQDVEALEQLQLLVAEGVPTDELIENAIALYARLGASDDEVVGFLRRVLDRHPELHGTRLELSRRMLRDPDNRAGVFREWDQLIKSSPADVGLHLAAARLYLDIGNRQRARELAEGAREAGAEEDVSNQLATARILAASGARADALEAAQQASMAPRMNAAITMATGTLLAELGDRASAGRVLQDGIDRHPDSAGLHQAIGLLRLANGERESSLSAYRTAAGLLQNRPYELAGLGEALVRAGLGSRQRAVFELGIESLSQAASAAPESCVLRFDLGQALLAGGMIDEGLAELERAATLAPENRSIQEALGAAQRATGRG